LRIFFQRAFWLNLAGACVVAIVAAVPILMSGVMDRGFEIAKQSVAEPLAVLALGAVLLAGGWNWLIQQGAATKIAASSLFGFLLLAVVSTALSENPEVAIFGGYYRREGLLAWSAYGAFFFAVLGWARSSGRVAGFLDALLLASVIPAAYVLQQRLDLDFYPVGLRDFTRPGGTMGSPLFLAAYLGLLLPITAVRCWQARRELPELALWLTVTSLQACGLLLTQTRGPLLAVFIGMLMLACFAAGYACARRVFFGAAAAFVVAAAALIAVNTLPSARQWAQDVPVVSRLIFNLDRDAGAETQRASSSAAARLGIWGAGVETFAAAPLASKLLGYGPESAYMHYFPHMPASVMRMVGYGAYHTYDRMHADALDIGLNFGLLAWLVYCLFFGSVMFAAARALWGLSGSAPPWIFFAFTFLGGVFSATAAVQTGLASAAVPAFGLGVGAGWFLFMVGCAWRAMRHGVPATSATQTGRWVMLAGLISAVLVFWVDAQINIPVLTTRLISFAIAALILIIADGIIRSEGKDAGSEPAAGDNLWVWGVACSLVAACASSLPITLFDASTGVQEVHWLRRALPILSFLLIAALAARGHARRSGVFSGGIVRVWLAIAVGLPLIYAAAHYALIVRPDSELSLSHVQFIAIASFAGPVFIFGMCIAFALLTSRGAALMTNAPLISRAARLSIGAVAASVVLVAALDWRATRADVASSLAHQASVKQPQLGEQLIEEAIRMLPYERYYRRQLAFDLLGRALADIRKLDEAPDRIPTVVRNLTAAETAARTAVLLFPRDPWVVVALANVLQVEALRVLRPLDPEGGLHAAQEANQLFARAHLMFPSEPLLLRNWAQLLSDQGNIPDAYRLLDLMEKLIPEDPEPYSERITMARQASDYATVSETLARARIALKPDFFSHLLSVAKEQQD
jgi:hypothetical protein